MLQKSFCCINHAHVCIYACFIVLVITNTLSFYLHNLFVWYSFYDKQRGACTYGQRMESRIYEDERIEADVREDQIKLLLQLK